MPETTWAKLRVNDWIICPASGLRERVTRNEPRPGGRRFVRTTRHDHNRPADETVERIDTDS